jgi:hypothetical protein
MLSVLTADAATAVIGDEALDLSPKTRALSILVVHEFSPRRNCPACAALVWL